MTVMLIRPMTPDTSRSGIVSLQYPINIGYLAAYLKKQNINCVVRDFEVEQFFENEFFESIEKNNPSLIGFSCMTPHIRHASHMARLVKYEFPEILTVIGGVHAAAIPEQTLNEFPQFDVAVIGEGEETLFELYKQWTGSGNIKEVSGIAFRERSAIKITPSRPVVKNIDRLPFPDRNLLDIAHYKKSHVSRGFSRSVMKISEIICSRGCPYNCIFCASKIVHSGKVRFRSAENIISEMKTLLKEHNTRHFSFLDDTFTIKTEILKPVCEFMKSQKVTFDCFTRVNDIDEEKIALMVSSGCNKISFGIESGSPRVLKLLKKGITLDQINRAVRIVKNAGLPTIETTFLIGSHPDETMEDIEMTRKLIYRIRPDILGIFIAIPYPGTELNRILKDRGLLLKENWDEFRLFFGRPGWELGNISMKQLQKILKRICYGYYMNPSYLCSLLLKIRSYKEFIYLVKVELSLIKTKIACH